MGYENNSRPDKSNPLDLLVDARIDLTDIQYWINEGGNPKDIIEAIKFIKETLLEYQRAVYPRNKGEDE